MGPSLFNPVDPCERGIALKVSQRKSVIHSWWDRTREHCAVMRMSDREACSHVRGNSLSDNSCSRTAASNYRKDRWTRRPWTLVSDMRARDCSFFALSLSHSCNGHTQHSTHSSTEQCNGRVARGTKSHFMCFSTANILAIIQMIQLKPSLFERSNLNYPFRL